MNKFTKLILTSAVFVTYGFATTIEGTQNITEGGLYEIKDNNCTLTGTMTFIGSETEGRGARLVINENRTLDIQGGTLYYAGSETYKPQITLNGTLKLSPNSEGQMPTINLENVGVSTTITETALKVGDSVYQIISQTNNGPVIEYETSGDTFIVYNGKAYSPTSGSISSPSFSTIEGTNPPIYVLEMGGYLRKKWPIIQKFLQP